VIEEVDDEEFDDDTDLPLPPLPNTGAQGPLLQELNEPFLPTPAASPKPQARQQPLPNLGEASASGEKVTVDPVTGKKTIWIQDASAYKMWTSVYPIYIDGKRPYSGSERRISREKSVWWPLSTDIVDACGQMGFKTLHEPTKRHPRDWENPGRVKVHFKEGGRFLHSRIKTKKQLLEAIGRHIQQTNPGLVPQSESATSQPGVASTNTPSKPVETEDITSSPNKKEKAKTDNHVRTAPAPGRKMKSRLPQPPSGPPRLSEYSPAQEANILIETVKAGMNAPPPGEGAGGQAALGGKGKRKVVRVRG